MPKPKTDEETAAEPVTEAAEGANAADPVELEPILLTVKAEHVNTPHGIELRRNGGNIVLDARTQDFASTETIGAKTIEAVIRECGADLPTGDQELVISISPTNGDVIAVAKA